MSSKKTCFTAGRKESDSRTYFEKKRSGFLKDKERIELIERLYAPMGAFRISWSEKTKVGLIKGTERKKESENTFYVDLHNADLFYVKESLLGKKRLERSDFLKKIIDLPLPAVEFLADIIRKGVISHSDLNKKHFLFLEGNFDLMLMLRTRELIGIENGLNPKYSSSINLPLWERKNYCLSHFLETEKLELEDKETDPVKQKPEEILRKLTTLLKGRGKYLGVTYMPYDRCKYVDSKNRFRYAELFSPEFVSP